MASVDIKALAAHTATHYSAAFCVFLLHLTIHMSGKTYTYMHITAL